VLGFGKALNDRGRPNAITKVSASHGDGSRRVARSPLRRVCHEGLEIGVRELRRSDGSFNIALCWEGVASLAGAR